MKHKASLFSFFGMSVVAGIVGFSFFHPQAAAAHLYEQIVEDLSKMVEHCQEFDQPNAGYNVVFRRDPMRALIDKEGNLTSPRGLYNGLAVQGIIQSEGLKLALINDEFFKPGAEVGAYKILEIRSDGLKTQHEGKTVFIPLYPESAAQEFLPAQ